MRWHREAESGPGERWEKVGEAVIENELDLLQYRDGIPNLTVREFCKRRKWCCQYVLGVIH